MFCSKHFVNPPPPSHKKKQKTVLYFLEKNISKDKLSFATRGGMRNVENVQSLRCLTYHIAYDSIYVLFPKMFCQNILIKPVL